LNKSLDEILEELTNRKQVISECISSLNRRKAYELLCDSKVSSLLLESLLSLQQIYGMVLSMHPESIYSSESKVNPDTIFNKVIAVTEKASEMIDITLDVYQVLKAETPRFLASEDYCYYKIVSTIEGTRWSFYGLLLRVVSDCEKLISFLEILSSGSAEWKKGELSRARVFGMAKAEKEAGEYAAGIIPPPPSLKKKEEG